MAPVLSNDPSMPQQPSSAPDGVQALLSQDAPALRQALESGWSWPTYHPPKHRQTYRTAPEISPLLQAIALDWKEGWDVMSAHDPGLVHDPLVVEAAVQACSASIVARLVEQGWRPEAYEQATGTPIGVRVALAMARDVGPSVDEDAVVAMVRSLESAGLDLLAPLPGPFEPEVDDRSPNGHTLWTWALACGLWHVVQCLAPALPQAQVAPRFSAAMARWFKEAWGPSVLPGDEGFKAVARARWLAWTVPFWSSWLQATDLITPDRPWTTAPLAHVGPAERAVVWERWCLPDASGWTGLHDAAVSSLEHVAVVSAWWQQMAQEHPHPRRLLKAWRSADARSQVRPCDLFAQAVAHHTGQKAWSERRRIQFPPTL